MSKSKCVWINYEACNNCGECEPVCPKKVLKHYPKGCMVPLRWVLCDGCGLCIDACEKGALEIRDLSPSFTEKRVCYFDEPGPQNTEKVCDLVASEVKRGIKYVVVASTGGNTALMMAEHLKGLNVEIIVFTIPPLWNDLYTHPTIPRDVKQQLESLDAKIMENAPAVIECGPETIECQTSYTSRRAVSTYSIGELLHGIGGQGLPTAVEGVFTAVQEKEIPVGVETISVGGTGSGADTAIIMKATPYEQMLSGTKENRFDLLEIIAIPKKKQRYW